MRRKPLRAAPHGPRSFFLLFVGLLTLPCQAQVGGTPTGAPVATGAHVPVAEKRSQYLNMKDTFWNKGEAAQTFGPDVGGVLDNDAFPEQAKDFVKPLIDWTAFDTFTSTDLQHYVGEIRRPTNKLGPDQASFEIVAPDPVPIPSIAKDRYVVCVLTVPPTHGNLNKPDQAPYVYPGDPNNYGLWSQNISGVWSRYPWPGADRVVEHFRPTAISVDFDVFSAYIVPSASLRPLVSTMQRYRQLRHIIIDRLTTDFGYTEDKIGFLVAGGSYGGLPAHLFPLMYPDEFHAGCDAAFHPSIRTAINDQDSYDFYSSALGRGNSGAGYSLMDATDLSIFCKIEGTDFLSMSLINRLALNRDETGGHVLRPIYLMAGDVDPVTHGNDWVKLIDPSATYLYSGRYEPCSTASPKPAVWWSIIGKACHGDGPVGEPMYIVPDTTVGTHKLLDAVWVMVQEARDQIPVVIPFTKRPPRKVPLAACLTTLEPHDHVFDRPPRPTPPVFPGDFLNESTTFKRHGHGTWLGWQESLVVHNQSVYVGSADGVITRFEQEDIAGLEPLVEQDRSNQNGVDYDLGYGVWALAVGDIDGDSDDEVVAASYRRIGVFDALTLDVEKVLHAPFDSSSEAWTFSWPRRIQIADLHPDPGAEIVFTTLHGKLMVLDQNLDVLASHDEAGIRDLIVGPDPGHMHTGPTAFTKPIYALSLRGHVLALEMDSKITIGPQGGLAAASDLQYGKMWDLEQVQWNGETELVGFFSSLYGATGTPSAGTQTGSIRIYDKHTLQMITEFGFVENPGGLKPLSPRAPRGLEPSLAIAQSGGTTYFVALYDQHLVVWDEDKNLVGLKDLASFCPARRACAVEAGDLDGDPGDEIVVSTLAGHVVWFKLSELLDLTPPFALGIPREVSVVPTVTFHDHRTNSTLATTWALAIEPGELGGPDRLRAVDQTGAWWRLDTTYGLPAQNGSLQLQPFCPEVFEGYEPPVGIAWSGIAKPKQLGVGQVGATGVNDYKVDPMGGAGRRISSHPYLPELPFSPKWTSDTSHETALLFQRFWVFQQAGAARVGPGVSHTAQWGDTFYPNHVAALSYDLGLSTPKVTSMWHSTGPTNAWLRPPVPTHKSDGMALRTEFKLADLWTHQACRLGMVKLASTTPHAVVSGVGGKVLLLDARYNQTAGANPILAQSDDYGFGGMALAVGKIDTDGFDDVVFAPYYDTINGSGDPASSTLRVLRHDGGTEFELIYEVPLPLNPSTGILGYAPSGIVLTDLTGNGRNDIVVTTLTGDMYAFQGSNGLAIDWNAVEGSLGGFNAIIAADVEGTSKEEIFVAGSMGLRRFNPKP